MPRKKTRKTVRGAAKQQQEQAISWTGRVARRIKRSFKKIVG